MPLKVAILYNDPPGEVIIPNGEEEAITGVLEEVVAAVAGRAAAAMPAARGAKATALTEPVPRKCRRSMLFSCEVE